MTVQSGILASEDIGPKLLGQGIVIGEAVENGVGGSHDGGEGSEGIRCKEVILCQRRKKKREEEKEEKKKKRFNVVMSFGVNKFGGVGGAAGY